MSKAPMFLTDAQLQAEIAKCEYCAEKPCQQACPCDCSPADFMMAAKLGAPSDLLRAATLILAKNPLGGVCGAVCPDQHCMRACSRRTFDRAVNIPAVQATLIAKARQQGLSPAFKQPTPNGHKVAIIGAGPAGLASAATLAQQGYEVVLFDTRRQAGGACLLIPESRLSRRVLASDIAFIKSLGRVTLKLGREAPAAQALLDKGFAAVVIAVGLSRPQKLGVNGDKLAVRWDELLGDPAKYKLKGRRVAIIGGGPIAVDCATTAAAHGAAHVELIARRRFSEMELTEKERQALIDCGAQVTGRTRPVEVLKRGGKGVGLKVMSVTHPEGIPYHSKNLKDLKGTEVTRKDFDVVIAAIGARPGLEVERTAGVFVAGDFQNGPTTVVEAVADGKNAAAEVHAFLTEQADAKIAMRTRSNARLAGRVLLPVPLTADFFGTEVISPFFISAAPHSDGYEQMKRAYESGWAGAVMKTAFDNVPIHIPSEYMFAFDASTYANCDNVSGHPLDRVCGEIERLRREYPDRLTMGSTGGSVTGDDERDRASWQANTRKLDAAGALGVEYSLSCPQGGDGTKGDIVSQDAELAAKIIDWVMQVSDPSVPKLFKLTGAVTAIYPILAAIKEVFDRYPQKKAGVTLANSFPTLAFRRGATDSKKAWDEGIVVGMSGAGVAPISYLTLANAARVGVTISGNGGAMDYKAAASFLALGARSVQFCTAVMKYGYGIVDELHSGLSFMLHERGMKSVAELCGCALPKPITAFGDLSPTKKVPAVTAALCQHCGNCTRCPYLAVTLDKKGVPRIDPACCIGCSICVQKCFGGALAMRARTAAELALVQE